MFHSNHAMNTLRLTARRAQRAFTLIEMMIVIALMAIIVGLVAPNMTEMIGMQRLRGINDQLVTDLQFMRSEAVSRNQYMAFLQRNVSGEPMSCYVVFSNSNDPLDAVGTDPTQCDCTRAIGNVCTGTQKELRTAQIPRDMSIELRLPISQPNVILASPISGGLRLHQTTLTGMEYEFCVEVRRTPRGRLRTGISMSGRTTVCSPDGSVPGVAACPAYDSTLKNCKATS